jgi:hypothetical protein
MDTITTIGVVFCGIAYVVYAIYNAEKDKKDEDI